MVGLNCPPRPAAIDLAGVDLGTSDLLNLDCEPLKQHPAAAVSPPTLSMPATVSADTGFPTTTLQGDHSYTGVVHRD